MQGKSSGTSTIQIPLLYTHSRFHCLRSHFDDFLCLRRQHIFIHTKCRITRRHKSLLMHRLSFSFLSIRRNIAHLFFFFFYFSLAYNLHTSILLTAMQCWRCKNLLLIQYGLFCSLFFFIFENCTMNNSSINMETLNHKLCTGKSERQKTKRNE